jgi:hypothetical protein
MKGEMTLHRPETLVRDKNYDLIAVIQATLKNAWKLETYIQDAEREGDRELVEWFSKIQENSRKAGDQGKHLLAQRLRAEES